MTVTDLSPPAADVDEFARMRAAMVASQLRTNAVSDASVVTAMARVPRERFVADESQRLAYRDTMVPLGGARFLNTPIATGRLLTAAALRAGDRVLLIGAATGYTAAVIAAMGAEVTAVEADEALVHRAREVLADTPAVSLVSAPLALGAANGAPYDALVIDGAVPEVPEALVQQVRIGGRIATGLVDRGVTRLAAGRRSEGGFGLVAFADIECALLPGFEQPAGFRF